MQRGAQKQGSARDDVGIRLLPIIVAWSKGCSEVTDRQLQVAGSSLERSSRLPRGTGTHVCGVAQWHDAWEPRYARVFFKGRARYVCLVEGLVEVRRREGAERSFRSVDREW